MARRLKPEQWAEIKTRVQFGDAVRAVARDFNISDSTIRERRDKEKWDLTPSVQVTDLKNKIHETTQNLADVTTQAQQPYVEQRLEHEINETLQVLKSITNLHKGALNLHGVILKKAILQTNSGELSPREASQILANTGMKVDQIHKAYTPEAPTTAIQVNNTVQNPIKIVFDED